MTFKASSLCLSSELLCIMLGILNHANLNSILVLTKNSFLSFLENTSIYDSDIDLKTVFLRS